MSHGWWVMGDGVVGWQADGENEGVCRAETSWDSTLYDESFGIITQLGAGVVELLAPRPGERIVDLGCGTGGLTAQIAAAGADVVGIDASEAMIARARELYPHLRFQVASGEDFALESPVDAVFSNAALHWMSPPQEVAASVARALKPGGRFVAEMGGKGNIVTITGAIYQALAEEGISREQVRNPWYFPSIGEYGSLLERAGFDVVLMQLFDRPTPLDDCPNGVADWLRMFGGAFLAAVPAARRAHVEERVNELTRPLLEHEGRWVADYRRLRFVAVKLSNSGDAGEVGQERPQDRKRADGSTPRSFVSGDRLWWSAKIWHICGLGVRHSHRVVLRNQAARLKAAPVHIRRDSSPAGSE